jgi:mono/diheme cytochrome c family protein
VPETEVILPVRLAMRFVAQDPQPQPRRAPGDTVALGRYLTTVGSCFECHTERNDKGEPVGAPFAGGNVFGVPGGGVARSANITPDEETGIGGWSREDFIARFKARTPEALDGVQPGPGEMDTEMPWSSYAGMTEEDLGAIYDYLRTVPAQHAEVVTYEGPAEQ